MEKQLPISLNTLPLVNSIVFYVSMSLTILDSQVSGLNGYISKRISRSFLHSHVHRNIIHNSQDTKIAHVSTDR